MNRFDLKDKSDEEVKALADAGEWIGIFDYGIRMYCQDRYQEAFDYLYKIKDSNNFVVWEYLINIAYYELPGIISDEELIALLFKRHEHGTSSYDYILAYCYEHGKGVEKDLTKYNELLAMCAKDGSYFATLELARNYENGYGVEKDLSKAYQLYYDYRDEHWKMDYTCAYKVAYYMYHELGGAKKDFVDIERYLSYAASIVDEAEKLYIEIYGKKPATQYMEKKKNHTIVSKSFIGKISKTRVACRAIVIKDDHILVSYEKANDKYMLPGGGLENEESDIDCCKREIQEETGLLIEPKECALTIDEYYDDRHYISHYFLADVLGEGKSNLTENEIALGIEPRWVPINELVEIFSQYSSSKINIDDFHRGIYFREYCALTKVLDIKPKLF